MAARATAHPWPRWSEWLFLVLVGLVAPFVTFPNRYTPAVLLLLPALSLVILVYGRSRRTPLDLPLLLFLTIVVASAALAIEPSLGQSKLAGVALGAIVLQGLASLEPTEPNIRRVSWLLLASAAVIALAGIAGTSWVTYKLGVPVEVYDRLPRLLGGVPGTTGVGFHPNEVGGTLALFFPFAWAFSIRRVDRPLRLAAILLFLLCAAVLVLSQSRSALFGVAVASLLMLVVMNKWLRYGTVAAVIAMALWLGNQGVEGLKMSLLALDQASSQIGSVNFAWRMEIWQRALYMLRDFPFTGVGLGTFPALSLARYPYLSADVSLNYGHAHNFLLETAIDFGLAGLLAVLALLVTFSAMLWRTWSVATNETCRALVLGLGGGIGAYLLFGLTDAINWGAKPGFFVWAYLGAAALVWETAGRPQLLTWAGRGEGRATSLVKVGRLMRPTLTAVACAIVLIAAMMLREPLASAVENNLGARQLGRMALAEPDRGLRVGGPELRRDRLQGVIERLEAAVRYNPRNAAAHRNLAQAFVMQANPREAAQSLLRATTLEPDNLLARYELAQLYSSLGETERSLPLYRDLIKRFPENATLRNSELEDYVMHFLSKGVDELRAGEPTRAVAELRKAVEARPGDLIAVAYLARALVAAGNEKEALHVQANLHAFTLSTDGRVYRRYLPELLPYLSEQGFLSSGELSRVASFLLWQGIADPAESLLDLLVRERPGDKEAWLMRAGMNARRGDRVAAIADLERALALDQRDANVYFLRGEVLEIDRPDAALDDYMQALSLQPDHLSALAAAAALLDRKRRAAEAEELRRRLVSLKSDARAVAARLGLSEGDIGLVSEALPNTDFQLGRPHPTGWRWLQWVGGEDFGDGFHVGGVDKLASYSGERSLRIAGLWAGRRKAQEPAAGVYRAPRLTLDGGSLYALSFSYKTENWQAGSPFVWIASDLSTWPLDTLPKTGGRWQRRTFLVVNRRPASAEVWPYFINWGVGDVWFADVRLSKVVARPGVVLRTAGLAELK